jgi:hypothetical protein
VTSNKIIQRIERRLGIKGLVTLLAEKVSPTDLQSLLLEVYRQRAGRLQPSAVLADYETNRFVRPAAISPVSLLEWERAAFSQLPTEFEPIALSPVTSLGTNSAVALVDQNKALSTIRNVEVVSDSTNVMALECALRRQHLRANPKSKTPVHLASSHRLLRTQQFDHPLAFPHFNIFALCSAGQDEGHLQFELSALALHIGFYVRAINAFLGSNVEQIRVSLTDFSGQDRQDMLAAQLLSPVQGAFTNVDCLFDPARESGRTYYVDLCFHIHAVNRAGQSIEIADGGVVNWTQRLLSNAKERCVTSGISGERILSAFD